MGIYVAYVMYYVDYPRKRSFYVHLKETVWSAVRHSPPYHLSSRRRLPARHAADRRRTGTTVEKVWEDPQLGHLRSPRTT